MKQTRQLSFGLLSVPALILFSLLLRAVQINQPLPLLLLVVLFAYKGGYVGGLLSTLTTALCAIFLFSEASPWYTPANLLTPVLLLITAAALAAFVLYLRARIDVLVRSRQELEGKAELLEAAREEEPSGMLTQNSALSRLSYSLRSPLDVMLGMTDLAIKHISQPTEAVEYLAKSQAAGTCLSGLVKDVMDVAKLDSGELRLYLKPTSYSTLTQMLTDLTWQAETAKRLKCKLTLPRHPLPTLMMDKARVNQILQNLISNAIQFTPEGGTIHLSLETEQDGESTFGQHLDCVFTVQDTGCGISPDFQPHLFEPFALEPGCQRNQATGLGLGLYIVKHLVTAMGGTAQVQSAQGKGTIVQVRLPIPVLSPKGMEASEDGQATSHDVLRDKHVLLAEDNPLSAEIVLELLAMEGVIVTCAQNGREAVALLRDSAEGHYAAILMDIHMPELDGLEATKEIRALPRADAATIPIIALSADAFEEDIALSLDSGLNHHLTKPLDSALLYHTLASVIK